MSALDSSWGGYCTGKPVATEERENITAAGHPCGLICLYPQFDSSMNAGSRSSLQVALEPHRLRKGAGPAHQETTYFVEQAGL